MGDPVRLLSVTSGADEVERELLASIRDVGPPQGVKGEAWHAIVGQLAAATLVGAAQVSAAGAASSGVEALAPSATVAVKGAVAGGLKAGGVAAIPKALAVKVVVVLAVAGAGAGSAAVWMNERVAADPSPKPGVTEQRPVTVATPAVLPPSGAKAATIAGCDGPDTKLPGCLPPPASSDPASSANRPSSPNRSSEARRSELLSAESRLIAQARAELRSGNIAAARAALERLHAEFPKGVLIQEREVLTIEVAQARGDSAGAKRRAQAFIKKYPESPHSTKLGRFLEKP